MIMKTSLLSSNPDGIPDKRFHSSRSHISDVDDVYTGIKPVALVEAYAAKHGLKLGLDVKAVPEGYFGPMLSKRLAYLVYRPDEQDKATRVLNILEKYPLRAGPRPAEYHYEMGLALGYPESDVRTFISMFFPSHRLAAPEEMVKRRME